MTHTRSNGIPEGAGGRESTGASVGQVGDSSPAAHGGTVQQNLPTPQNLYDYGLIGNMHTAALISRHGSVDWACMPHFASPSVFARLLDDDHGGFHAVRPVEEYQSSQYYWPSTNILETVFLLAYGRKLTVTDFMPLTPGGTGESRPMIVRSVSARGGDIGVSATFCPRFDYGEQRAQFLSVRSGHLASSGKDRMLYLHPTGKTGTTTQILDRLETELMVAPYKPATFELIWGDTRPTPNSPEQLLNHVIRFWRTWVWHQNVPTDPISMATYASVERSALVLKMLSHERTGAFVAAPTMSLPEWPGGVRNWDYRYAWIRDATLTARALITYGHSDEARSYLGWVLERAHHRAGSRIRVVYDVHGETDLKERVLGNLKGFLGSRPVRLGNSAFEQFQLDIYGTLLDTVSAMADIDPKFIATEWPHIADLADEVLGLWRTPDRGMWEVPGEPLHYVHSKLMAWVALDRAARLSMRFGTKEEGARWEGGATLVRAEILEKGYDAETNSFIQAYERPVAAASTLQIPMEGFLPYTDPKVLGTIERVSKELSVGPFVYRYKEDDGIEGPEGAFLLCSFWLVECLARSGQVERALQNWNALMESASPLGLFPEEYDPVARVPLGNYPQAFTHIGVLRAARAFGLVAKEARSLQNMRPTAHHR